MTFNHPFLHPRIRWQHPLHQPGTIKEARHSAIHYQSLQHSTQSLLTVTMNGMWILSAVFLVAALDAGLPPLCPPVSLANILSRPLSSDGCQAIAIRRCGSTRSVRHHDIIVRRLHQPSTRLVHIARPNQRQHRQVHEGAQGSVGMRSRHHRWYSKTASSLLTIVTRRRMSLS